MKRVMVIDYKNFDEKIREAFDDFEPRPPAHVWYGVVAGMTEPARKRLTPLLLRIAAAVAVLMVTSVSFWFLTFQPYGNAPDEIFAQLADEEAGPVSLRAVEILAENNGLAALSLPRGVPGLQAGHAADNRPGVPAFNHILALQSLPASLSHGSPGLKMPVASAGDQNNLFSDMGESLALVDESRDFSFLSIGIHYAPQYSYRHIINSTEINNAGIPFEYLEDPIFSFNLGFSLQARVRPWLSLQTGFNYGTIGQFVSNIIAFSHPDNLPIFELDKNSKFSHSQTIVTSQGNIRLSEPRLFFADSESYRVITNKQFDFDGGPESLKLRDFGISQHFTYLEIPVLARVKVATFQNAEFSIKAGGSLNYILGNEVFLGRKTMLRPIGETYGLRKFNFSAHSGFAVNIPIGEHFQLQFEPTVQMYLMPMVRDRLMIGRALPFQYSLFTGITYSF